MSNVAVIDQARPRETRIQVIDPVPVLDTGRFEQMVRVAKVMASSNLIPETLCATAEGNGRDRVVTPLAFETVMANCFLIVNQAVGWGMDPFAVAQCASVVHGRVCYEGKLIAAVIEQKLGVRLEYEWNEKPGDALGIIVRGTLDGKLREVKGTVGEWKTTGSGSPWFKQPRTQLAYRGARDWARLHAPSVMLGVYSSDEMEAAVDRQERLPARPVMVGAEPPQPPPAQSAPQPQQRPSPRLPPAPPPAPPKAVTPPPPPAQSPGSFDFDAFRAELQKTTTMDEANAAFDAWIVPREKHMSSDELDEAQAVLREITETFGMGDDQ